MLTSCLRRELSKYSACKLNAFLCMTRWRANQSSSANNSQNGDHDDLKHYKIKKALEVSTELSKDSSDRDQLKLKTDHMRINEVGMQQTTKLEKYLAVYFRKDLYPTIEDVPDFLQDTKRADLRWKFLIRLQVIVGTALFTWFFFYQRGRHYERLEKANKKLESTVMHINSTK